MSENRGNELAWPYTPTSAAFSCNPTVGNPSLSRHPLIWAQPVRDRRYISVAISTVETGDNVPVNATCIILATVATRERKDITRSPGCRVGAGSMPSDGLSCSGASGGYCGWSDLEEKGN
ncbi:hypothetical protein Bbelb_137390 [Branchiostoma belcheri]|nr:hypothetical protein Bbelb_137390 [Branchiostoma belcheri]